MAWAQAPGRFASLLGAEPVFALLLAGSLAVSGYILWRRRCEGKTGPDRVARALTALTVVQCLQFLMVVKHPAPHYLMPSLGLAGLNLTLIWLLSGRRLSVRHGRWLAAGLAAIVVVVASPRLGSATGRLAGERDEQLRVFRAGDALRAQGRIATYYTASDALYALAFGNEWAGWRYGGALARLYPDALFYEIWAGRYYTFTGALPVDAVLQLATRSPLYLHGTGGREIAFPTPAKLVIVVPGTLEVVYRVEPVRRPDT